MLCKNRTCRTDFIVAELAAVLISITFHKPNTSSSRAPGSIGNLNAKSARNLETWNSHVTPVWAGFWKARLFFHKSLKTSARYSSFLFEIRISRRLGWRWGRKSHRRCKDLSEPGTSCQVSRVYSKFSVPASSRALPVDYACKTDP